MPEELTISEAIDYADLSNSQLARLMRVRRITGRKIGNTWLLDKASLDAYLHSNRKPGVPRGTKRQQNGAGQPAQTAEASPAPQKTVLDTPEGAHIRIDALQPQGDRWLLAEATRGDMRATLQLRPYGTGASVYTLDRSYDRLDASAPGKMGRMQEQRGEILLQLLEKHMRQALEGAGWHTEDRAGNELWRYAGSEG